MKDVVIVGGGPAGLTAAVYALRASKTALVIEKASYGGQINFSPKIENYPGFGEITGLELADKISSHAISLGAECELDEIRSVEKIPGGFRLNGDFGSYEGKTVILATGAEHRRLGIEGEEKFTGNGVSFCAVCDGAFYAGRDVAVIGGGNSALQEAMLLSENCRSVTVIQNLPTLTGEKTLEEKLFAKENVSVIYNSVATEFVGEDALTGVKINSGEIIPCDGVFVAIGLAPATAAFKEIAKTDDYGYFAAAEDCLTDTPGVFVAGDCRAKGVRQITTAVADGAAAALAAVRYLG